MNPAVLTAFALVIIAGGGPPAFPESLGMSPICNRRAAMR